METCSIVPKVKIQEIDTNSDTPNVTEKVLAALVCSTQTFNVTIEGSDLQNHRTLMEKLSTATVNFPVLDKDSFVFAKSVIVGAPARVVYSTPGHYGNAFVYANGYFDYIHNLPCFNGKFDAMKDFDCIENSYVSLTNTCRPYCHWDINTAFGEMRAFFDNFCSVFDKSEVLAVFGAGLGVCFWDIFQKIGQGFPVLILTGESQSGKTTIAKALSAIYGLFSDSGFTSGSSTLHAIHMATSQRHNIPLFVEELNAKSFETFDVFVKNIFSAIPRERGKSKKSNDIIKVYTSVFATSNHFFTNPKVETLSRILTATMRKSDFDLSKYEYFNMQKRKQLSKILPCILAYRSHVEKFYNDVATILSPVIKDDRCLNNLTISSVMWHIVNNILGHNYVNWLQMSLDTYAQFNESKAAEIKAGDFVIRSIAQLIEKGQLIYGKDYKLLKDNKTLKIGLHRFAEKQNIHASQTSYLVKEQNLRKHLQNDSRFNLVSIPTGDLGRTISIDISDQEYLIEKILSSKNMYGCPNDENEENNDE